MSYCYLSTSLCRNQSIEEAIIKCGDLSNKHVELSAPHPFQTTNEISILFKKYKVIGYNFTLHNYFPPPQKSFVLNIASNQKDTINECRNIVNSALTLSLAAESPLYGVHAGYLSKATAKKDGMFKFEGEHYSYSDALKRSAEFINSVVNSFIEQKKKFLVENLFPSVARNSSLFCDLNQINDLMSQVPKEVGLLLDLGHLNISSKIMNFDREKFLDNFLEKYGDRLHEVHISENDGLKDEHRALEENSWQYDAIKKIHEIKNSERVYCLESRNAEKQQLVSNLDQINNIIS